MRQRLRARRAGVGVPYYSIIPLQFYGPYYSNGYQPRQHIKDRAVVGPYNSGDAVGSQHGLSERSFSPLDYPDLL